MSTKTEIQFAEIIQFAPDIRAGKTMVRCSIGGESIDMDSATYAEQGTENIPFGHRLWSPDSTWSVTAKRYAELLANGSIKVVRQGHYRVVMPCVSKDAEPSGAQTPTRPQVRIKDR